MELNEIDQKLTEWATKHDTTLLRFFTFGHLPRHLSAVSQPFAEMALRIVGSLPSSAERTTCLRKLLEAKDCAVRAAL